MSWFSRSCCLGSVAAWLCKYYIPRYGLVIVLVLVGNLEIAEILVVAGADVNEDDSEGNSPLLLACRSVLIVMQQNPWFCVARGLNDALLRDEAVNNALSRG